MSGLSEFLAMGGYAAYVWSAYGLSLVVLAGLVVTTARRHRRVVAEVRAGAARAASPAPRPEVHR
jgi:heme exporter protein D